MLIVLAGLPGTGKSTLAAALGGAVLNKDVVRAALFPPPALDYSDAQNDLSMEAIYAAAGLILKSQTVPVVIDGRPFTRRRHVDRLLAVAAELGVQTVWVECVCSDALAESRIAADHAIGTHPAGDRTPDLHRRQKAAADPLTVPRLVLDTGELTIEECVRRVREYTGL